MLVSNVGSAETFLPQNSVVLNRHYMDSLNLNCLKQDPTTTGTCARLINMLYCISAFAINVYNIWSLPVFYYTTLFYITLACISSDATNVRFTLHHNSLANAEVWRCIFICRVRLTIHIIVIQFPDEQKFKFTIRCFAQHQFSGECSEFGVLWAL